MCKASQSMHHGENASASAFAARYSDLPVQRDARNKTRFPFVLAARTRKWNVFNYYYNSTSRFFCRRAAFALVVGRLRAIADTIRWYKAKEKQLTRYIHS